MNLIFSEDYSGPRFTYGMRYRPLATGAQPKGFIIGSQGAPSERFTFGTIQYPRPLTEEEIYSFEMEEIP